MVIVESFSETTSETLVREMEWQMLKGRFVNQTGVSRGSEVVYCFPCAGGNASSYLAWRAAFPGDVEVCPIHLPGRGIRFGEPPRTDFRNMVCEIGAEIALRTDRPYYFFGHSFGSLLAFEVTRYLVSKRFPEPKLLFVAGCSAPRYRDEGDPLHTLDNERLIEELRDYNGTPAELLASRELMDLLLPAIRADMQMAETYEYAESALLTCPISVLSGEQDKIKPDAISGWGDETSGAFDSTTFKGGHFFVQSESSLVVRHVLDRIRNAKKCL